jgi:hypothetical protein
MVIVSIESPIIGRMPNEEERKVREWNCVGF